jgi:hypothetical protein
MSLITLKEQGNHICILIIDGLFVMYTLSCCPRFTIMDAGAHHMCTTCYTANVDRSKQFSEK